MHIAKCSSGGLCGRCCARPAARGGGLLHAQLSAIELRATRSPRSDRQVAALVEEKRELAQLASLEAAELIENRRSAGTNLQTLSAEIEGLEVEHVRDMEASVPSWGELLLPPRASHAGTPPYLALGAHSSPQSASPGLPSLGATPQRPGPGTAPHPMCPAREQRSEKAAWLGGNSPPAQPRPRASDAYEMPWLGCTPQGQHSVCAPFAWQSSSPPGPTAETAPVKPARRTPPLPSGPTWDDNSEFSLHGAIIEMEEQLFASPRLSMF